MSRNTMIAICLVNDSMPTPLAPLLLERSRIENRSMLRITTESKRGKTFIYVEGRIAGPQVATLEQCWRELYASAPRLKYVVNLCGVSFIDRAGKILLQDMHRLGAELQAEGCLNQAIVEEISKSEGSEGEKPAKKHKGSHIIFYVVFFGLLGISRAALLPQANFGVQDSANRVNLRAEFGGKPLISVPGVPALPGHIGPYQLFQVGPNFSTPIFDLSLWKQYQASRSNLDAARANSLSTREQVILLVVSQYIGALRNVADVEASRSRVDLAQALYDQAADLQKEGVGTGIDTLRANVELQNEKQRLIEAENNRDASLFGLSKLLNLDPRQNVQLADLLGFFETPQPEVDASIDQALEGRPEWTAIEAQEKAVQYDNQSAEFSRLPTLKFQGYWAEQGTSASNVIPVYQYAAVFDVPIFTSGRIKAEVARADLDV